LAKSTWNQGTANTTNSGYLLYAFRGGDNGTGKPRPSTNRVVNCIFANNSWRGGARQDIPSYRTATTVVVPAQNVLCNCLYEQGLDWEMLEVHDSLVGKPRFVLDDQRYPGVPPYMIRRVSPARKAGLVMPWMADETDFAGTAMVSGEGTVDMGAYQCTLPAHGLILTVR